MTKREIEFLEKYGPEMLIYKHHCAEYDKELKSCINRKKAGVFAPEDMQFIKTVHEQIRELMKELERSISI